MLSHWKGNTMLVCVNSTFIVLSCTQIVKKKKERKKEKKIWPAKARCFYCEKWSSWQRLVLSWLVWSDTVVTSERRSRKQERETGMLSHTLCLHVQDSGNQRSASQWAVRGTQRAERSVFICVCVYPIVNRDKKHMPCHRLSPLSLLPPLLSALHSLSPDQAPSFLCALGPSRCPLASFCCSNSHPTWSAC